MLAAQEIDTDNLVVAAFTLDGHGGDEKTDLLELWRNIWKISSQLPAGRLHLDYQTVDRLCLSLLFHVSLWSLRYGVQMEEVLRTLGAHYTDIHQCGTLTSKRDFVLACLFACQQALAHRRNHGRTVNSVAQRVREYVDSEYASHMISLESVAASVHKTLAYISRVFKNELGCNFSDYLTEKRMRRAAELLKEPDGKVYLIAQQCGYADTSNFIRVFKKYYGISPVEYRAAQGGAEIRKILLLPFAGEFSPHRAVR